MRGVKEAADSPCSACPWRTKNHGKRHPDHWYTKRNLKRLWAGLRRGESMSCHPTDPRNPVSESAQRAGTKPAPESADTRECAGALILQQREFMLLQNRFDANLGRYRKERPGGLTKEGMAVMLSRAIFGGIDGPKMAKPNLDQSVSWPGDRS